MWSLSVCWVREYFIVNKCTYLWLKEELGSDEDDIDEDGQEYLEILAKQAGEDGDDEDWEEDDAEETALEGYSTIIDDEDNPVDEYQIFKAIFQSKSTYVRFVIPIALYDPFLCTCLFLFVSVT